MKKLFDLPKIKLSEQESNSVNMLIQVRNKYNTDRDLLQITINSLTSSISLMLRDFAFKHKLNLNKGYKLEGNYPDFYLVRERKLPFKKSDSDKSIKGDNGQIEEKTVLQEV